MSRAEKIKRIREIMLQVSEYWNYVDECIDRDDEDKYIENHYYWIEYLEQEKVSLIDELERESY